MTRLRYALGRWLVHAGLRLMPPGRPRSELHQLLELWGTKVQRAVRTGRENVGGTE